MKDCPNKLDLCCLCGNQTLKNSGPHYVSCHSLVQVNYFIAICVSIMTYTQVSLEDDFHKRFEYEFHSASYLNIMEVITGLKIAVAQLIQKV